ncbi:tRNA uridine-5-carboxymethylaminomethyl(34) synthesis enzyme MnmG [Algicella marina]|uniref:tRNA uridine 5-carboxymethylaminomethyl modification enzyme MnmG n=1 Tax=Algicella marina TaxID=2683284 RepID=A0A6P1T4A6_9RHOB|nr:tRNA uridine-5-carboxymethylaminomethyl(34) synthesis enzyme MnmG [Algicella marina]QHQ36601.1 tRNA uridine-5-carboxymethylaminomethyl(34) synthesis enzyme MnmG [Algicella marina]
MFHVKHSGFDVLVVGGGHAGVEAARAAAQIGARTVLITHRLDRIGEMSCNPAIGGIGKGHLVREIDALGGWMGVAADFAAIQYRLLNRKKGPAVQGPRTQADRALYRQAMQRLVSDCAGLEVIESGVRGFVWEGSAICGVILDDGVQLAGRSVVLTAGTFLNGVIHIGEKRIPGGRAGDPASVALGDELSALGLPVGRLKTGTPARLDGRTINWDAVGKQDADDDPVYLSQRTTSVQQRQIACGITETNEATHEIIDRNLMNSALHAGHISGKGPRYCPSIEDKVVRFSEKSSHQVFLEPEGLVDHSVYPNGISTSLPEEIQSAFIRTMRGLEQVEILRPGYAIEYDYFDPRALTASLEVKEFDGLFFAGQINGTTGYEEAAAQGLVAGLNAALKAFGREPNLFRRSESYIGVMIDDLVTLGVTEPYRMFTSRAEFRLLLRADNADQRLSPLAHQLGLLSEDVWRGFSSKMNELNLAKEKLEALSVTSAQARRAGLDVSQDGSRRSGLEMLSLPGVTFGDLISFDTSLSNVSADVRQQLSTEALYGPYLDRQRRDAAILAQDEGFSLPTWMNYGAIPGLSAELSEKLAALRPETLSQARRIEGITPTALSLIMAVALRGEKRAAG